MLFCGTSPGVRRGGVFRPCVGRVLIRRLSDDPRGSSALRQMCLLMNMVCDWNVEMGRESHCCPRHLVAPGCICRSSGHDEDKPVGEGYGGVPQHEVVRHPARYHHLQLSDCRAREGEQSRPVSRRRVKAVLLSPPGSCACAPSSLLPLPVTPLRQFLDILRKVLGGSNHVGYGLCPDVLKAPYFSPT